MFGMGLGEILVIGVVALLVIGPQQLPHVARVVGRLFGEIRKATQDLSGGLLEATNEVNEAVGEAKKSFKEGVEETKKNLIGDEETVNNDKAAEQKTAELKDSSSNGEST